MAILMAMDLSEHGWGRASRWGGRQAERGDGAQASWGRAPDAEVVGHCKWQRVRDSNASLHVTVTHA